MAYKLKPIEKAIKAYDPSYETLRKEWEGDPEERAKRLRQGDATRRLLGMKQNGSKTHNPR